MWNVIYMYIHPIIFEYPMACMLTHIITCVCCNNSTDEASLSAVLALRDIILHRMIMTTV